MAFTKTDRADAREDAPRHRRAPPRSILVAAAQAPLQPAPIDPAWLIGADAPDTQAALVASNDDGTTATYIWQTSRARYRWEHASDEIVTVLDGWVYLRDEDIGPERRLGPGDVAFFPAGARTLWRVPERLRKVSTLVRPVPRPFAWTLRRLRSAKRAMLRLRRPAALPTGQISTTSEVAR